MQVPMQVRERAVWILALAAALAAGPAAAQYQWRDASGTMHFSDRPPPASVHTRDVVRQPGPRAASAAPAAPAVAAAATAATNRSEAQPAPDKPLASGASPTAADRELAFRKRQLERAQAERKLAERSEQLERQARACDEARAYQRTLESGMRIAQVDAHGEREFLSEQARAQRLATVRRDLQEHCKAG